MFKPRRLRNNPCGNVPEELLYKGYAWETLRENYFKSIDRLDDALEANYLRSLYARRLWEECEIQVEPFNRL
jgi:hypothetical protein